MTHGGKSGDCPMYIAQKQPLPLDRLLIRDLSPTDAHGKKNDSNIKYEVKSGFIDIIHELQFSAFLAVFNSL